MLWWLVAGLSVASLMTLLREPAGIGGSDFSCFWAGAKVALHDPHRLYDFAYVTQQQGWPFGHQKLRPFIYPPSSLPLFMPFTLAPYWVDYALWVISTGLLFLWGGLKARAPWWFMLLSPVVFAILCGQTTLLIGGLVVGGLALLAPRPLVAGLLFGIAAAVKPQIVVLVPIALIAEGRWRTLLAAGATVGGLAGASAAIWGLAPWLDWLAALPRFQGVIANDLNLVKSAVTPFAVLQLLGVDGRWALVLAPLAPVAVWMVFRRTSDVADRSIAIFASTLLVSPYAMNYEAALLAPAAATYLMRVADRRWPAYVVAAAICVQLGVGVFSPLAAAALPGIRHYRPKPAYTPA